MKLTEKQLFMKSIFKLHSKGSVLDLGFAEMPNDDILNITGIDIKKCKKPNNYDKVIQADLNKGIPLSSGLFDTVIAGDVIEHLENPVFFVKECSRVLKKNGTLIITAFNAYYLWHIFGRTDDEHYSIWTHQYMKKILSMYNLEISKSIGTGFEIPFTGFVKVNVPRKLSKIMIFVCKKR
jgi:SAM-dependent methyltransferase